MCTEEFTVNQLLVSNLDQIYPQLTLSRPSINSRSTPYLTLNQHLVNTSVENLLNVYRHALEC